MELSHLIVGNNEDYHAIAVAWALRQMGEPAIVWDGISATLDGQICLRPDDDGCGISLGGDNYRSFKSVWFRRPIRYRNIDNVAPHVLEFVKNELRYSYSNLAAALVGYSSFVVGGGFMDAVACKDYQLRCAKAAGFKVPRTLITNSFDEASRFVSVIGRVALKPFNPFFWHDTETKNLRVASTAIISSIDELTAGSVQACPSIYQEYINKKHELRITVIGNRVFTAMISRAGGGSFVDWRLNLGKEDAVVESMRLDPAFEAQIVKYVRGMGLAYGCLDFVVDTEDEPWFLEINPGGQFLFVEDLVPEFRLLEAFSTMLMMRSFDYQIGSHPGVSSARFDQTEEFKKMQDMRGKIMVNPPLYGKVNREKLDAVS